jgi:hypothetical protein
MPRQTVKNQRMDLRRQIGNRAWKPPVPRPTPARTYLVAHACFSCRESFKLPLLEGARHPCPQCMRSLFEMGRSFKAPPLADREQWEKVQGLYALGFRFWSYGYGQLPVLPARLKDIAEFVASNPKHPSRTADRNDALLPDSLIGIV